MWSILCKQIIKTVNLVHRQAYAIWTGFPCILLDFQQEVLWFCMKLFQMILDKFLRAMDESMLPYVSTQWLLGKKYIFFR